MYEIKRYERLTDNIFLLDVYAPRVAKKCLAGQFVIIRVDDKGERIPLTVCDFDRDKSLVTVVVQEIGATTYKTGKLRVGDCLADFVGPLGNPSELTQMPIGELKNKKVVFVAGGVGAAPVYPQVKYLHENGVKADVIVGAKNKDLLILQNELRNVAENVFVTTDDGSCGDKGLVTDKLQKLVASGKNYDLCVAIGPVIMMKFVSALTKLMYLGAMNGISDSISEAARLDGASNIQEFVYIVFPMIYPTFSTLFYTSVATIFTNQINLYSLWGASAPSSTWTFGYYLYKEVAQAGEARYPSLAALGVLMTVVAAPLTFFFKWLLRRVGPKVD